MTTKCRGDCEYYSSYTETCDYTLLMYESRGCPTSACVKYKPRTRKHSRYRSICQDEREGMTDEKEERCVNIPETDASVVNEPGFTTAGCGHEVYDGEYIFEGEDGGALCPECMEAAFDELSTSDKAALLGCTATEIRLRGLYM